MRAWVHAITPGDHFSPSTGSAVPTVVDGLARAAAPPQYVLVAEGTYADRYGSASALGYTALPGPGRIGRYLDVAASGLSGSRILSRRALAPLVAAQHTWPPAVVLAHNLVELAALIDRQRHVPVLYAHNELLRTYPRRSVRRTLEPVAAVVCVSEHLADRFRSALPPGLASRVVCVPNGVDCTRFHPRGRTPSRGPLHVGFVGRTIPAKGPDVLLEAAGLLPRGSVRVTVVGSDGFDAQAPLTPFEEGLRRRACELGLEAVFLPFTDRGRLPAVLRSFDVLVVPSRWPEPWGLTAGEGLASGAAVVTSAVGGLPEVVGSAGVLVPPNDPRSLAEQLERFATDREECAAAGAAGRRHAESHDWAVAAERLRVTLDVVGAS